MKISKKKFVLIALFIFPLLFFLVLSTGINRFVKLPVLTSNVDLKELEDLQSVSLNDQVTVLCFLGNDIKNKKGGFFNLNQKIYKEFYDYRAFQIIVIYPEEVPNEVSKLKSDLGAFTDMSKWKFIPFSKEDISLLFSRLGTVGALDANFYSKRVYILDKEKNLRGRTDDKDSTNGVLFGYNIQSVAELNNKMEDDIKVLLYEYRAAFKNKNNPNRKDE
ncbi:MAG: hypothetical protein JKY02_06155 [Flavobacteriaceae bacterium]|nr:hypothetical protein [Flavobacteriaceae bacterium]